MGALAVWFVVHLHADKYYTAPRGVSLLCVCVCVCVCGGGSAVQTHGDVVVGRRGYLVPVSLAC